MIKSEADLDEEKGNGLGRPTLYDPGFAVQAEKLCKLGATDLEIADFFDIHVSTLYRWKHTHPDFCDAIRRAKEVADDIVEESLFRRATGYSHEAVKIFMPAGAPAPVYAPYTEHFPPDATAMIFWLKNRQPDKWRDRHEIEGDLTISTIAERIAAVRRRDERG